MSRLENLGFPPAVIRCVDGWGDKYEIVKVDEKAANGYLLFARNKVLNTKVAIKFYYWGGQDAYHAEPKALTQLRCEHLLPVLDADYVDDAHAFFVTPFCEGGDIDDYLSTGRLCLSTALQFTRDILDGLSHLHAARFLHRDIKPSNVFVSPAGAVVGDFGSLKLIPEGQQAVPPSSHAILYRPPESFGEEGYFAAASDLYQAGVVLYQLLGGYLPYEETAWLNKAQRGAYDALVDNFERQELANSVLEDRIRRGKLLNMAALPLWVPQSLKRLVRSATNPDANRRYGGAAEFLAEVSAAQAALPNWVQEDGVISVGRGPYFRITLDADTPVVEKRGNAAGAWRRDNALTRATIAETIAAVAARLQ